MSKHKHFFYIFITIISIIILSIQYAFWFSNTGYFSYKSLSAEVQKQQESIDSEEKNNLKLYSEVVSLRKDNTVLEGLARENMGFIKKGEVFYTIE